MPALVSSSHNDGQTFSLGQTLITGSKINDALTLDFTRDGTPDIVAASANKSLMFTLQNIKGAFTGLPTSYTEGSTLTYLSAGDMDRDGRIDVLATGYEAGMTFVRNLSK